VKLLGSKIVAEGFEMFETDDVVLRHEGVEIK
jgi:hypothetical protein